jgi:DNA-directed RNA polymerase specialized sigma24 family protein
MNPGRFKSRSLGGGRWAEVVAALQQLSPVQREVLLLHMVAGLTAPEVATALGKTIGQVKALRHRGQANLARVLGLRSLE